MTDHALFSANLLIAYSAYFVGTASPGPSNLAIMSIASTSGRRAAFAFAAGVMSGSFYWAMLAALGLSAALTAYSGFLIGVKICGGLYLLWLAFKSGRAALRPPVRASSTDASGQSGRKLYARGALLHLTNPKAILVWMSVAALGSSSGEGRGTCSSSSRAVCASACACSAAMPRSFRWRPRGASTGASSAD